MRTLTGEVLEAVPDFEIDLFAGLLRGRLARDPASRVAARRGRNIGVVAAARRQLEYVYYALRDHHVRALHTQAAA